MRDLSTQGLESAINTLIQLDPQAPSKLASLHGQVVEVRLRGLALSFFFIPDHSGRLTVLRDVEQAADACIEGSPIDLLRASDQSASASQLFAGHVTLHGNTELAHRFSQILGGLQIDWEEWLSQHIGDIGAHQIALSLHNLRDRGIRLGQLSAANLSEYLTEELRLLPHRYEFEALQDDTETLRDDQERLAARVRLLESSAQ